MGKDVDFSAIKPDLYDAVVAVAGLVKDAGGRALMVGGAVRDLLMGAPSVKDVDIEVFGIEPDRLQRILGERFAFDPCGVSFGVLKLHKFDIDVSLPRRESKRGIGHKGFLIDSDPNLSIPEAASRRDFTVNAMYYDPLAGAFEPARCATSRRSSWRIRCASCEACSSSRASTSIPRRRR